MRQTLSSIPAELAGNIMNLPPQLRFLDAPVLNFPPPQLISSSSGSDPRTFCEFFLLFVH